MPPSRRERIETMLADEPGDPFLRYSLAMELDKEGQHEASLNLLKGLAGGEPPYVPACFMAGQQLARLGRIGDARAALREGIEVARRQGDAHAAGEMSEFLASLGALGEADEPLERM
jgi:thioredoxin-like negative regulator of GroEL